MEKRNLSSNPSSKILKPGFLLKARSKPEKVKTTFIGTCSTNTKPGILKKKLTKQQNKISKVKFLTNEAPVNILADRTNSSTTQCPAITRMKIKPTLQKAEDDSDFISLKMPVGCKTFSFSKDINSERLSASPILTSNQAPQATTPRRLMKIIQTPPPKRVLLANMREKTNQISSMPIKKLEFSTSKAVNKTKDIKISTQDDNFANPASLEWILNRKPNQPFPRSSVTPSSELIRASDVIQTRYMPDGRPSCSRIPLIEVPRVSEGPGRILISKADDGEKQENKPEKVFKKPAMVSWKQKNVKNLNRNDQVSRSRNTISSISTHRPFSSQIRKTATKPKLSLYEPPVYQPLSKLKRSSQLAVNKTNKPRRCGSKPKDDFVEETVTPVVLNQENDKDVTFCRVVAQLSKQMDKIKRKSMKVEFESAIKLLQRSREAELKDIEEETATSSVFESCDVEPSPSDVTEDSMCETSTSKEEKDQISSDLYKSFKNHRQLKTNQPGSLTERLSRFRLDDKYVAMTTTTSRLSHAPRNQLRYNPYRRGSHL